MALLISGVGVSHGISIGRVHILSRDNKVQIKERHIPRSKLKAEVVRFQKAQKKAALHLRRLRESIPREAPVDIAEFIDSHLLMLDDSLLGQVPIDIINKKSCNAEWALKLQQEQLVEIFDQMHDDYLRTRRNDIEHVIGLIQGFLANKDYRKEEQSTSLKNRIVVADDLTPADTIVLQHQHVAGFITELGGQTSHTAILARSLKIPAVVAAHNVKTLLREDEKIILDGRTGVITAAPDEQLLKVYRAEQRKERKHWSELQSLIDKKTISRDRTKIRLMVNVDLAEDLRGLKKSGAEGIGLYRTEFLYLGEDQVTEEDGQFRIYRKVVRAMEEKPVTIRTLDVGAEKEFDPEYRRPLASNPALGMRAIRRSLKDPETFLTQLRAILRSSAYGQVRIMFPMLTNLHELKQILQLLQLAKAQLLQKKKRYDKEIKIGGMIEVPAAALLAPVLAKHLDFLSIGTNDLIQYTLAIDRIDDEVSYLYDPLHPGFLRLVAMVLDAGKKENTPVSMCGEMAADTRYTRLLLGLGLREYSVPPSALLEIKKIIRNSDISDLQKKCRQILSHTDTDKISALIASLQDPPA